MAEFFNALGNVGPYAVFVLIVAFFLAQIFGFQPIRILQKHGVIVALAVIASITLVAVLALFLRQPEPSHSRLTGGASLQIFFENNAKTASRRYSIVPGDDNISSFKVKVEHRAANDRELAFAICGFYEDVQCGESDSNTIVMSLASQD